ncbi:MAG: hypothetical protein HQK92_16005, partial [Nitrospirae bacterium]|nr:hypothetical protein [Nitrospirota bacterium]
MNNLKTEGTNMQGHGKGMCGSSTTEQSRSQGMGKGCCHGKRLDSSDVTGAESLKNRLSMLDKERDEVANRLSKLEKTDT